MIEEIAEIELMYRINAFRWLFHYLSLVLLGCLGANTSNQLPFLEVTMAEETRVVITVILSIAVVVSGIGNIIEAYTQGRIAKSIGTVLEPNDIQKGNG
jgi:uncharacterized membrane protein